MRNRYDFLTQGDFTVQKFFAALDPAGKGVIDPNVLKSSGDHSERGYCDMIVLSDTGKTGEYSAQNAGFIVFVFQWSGFVRWKAW